MIEIMVMEMKMETKIMVMEREMMSKMMDDAIMMTKMMAGDGGEDSEVLT